MASDAQKRVLILSGIAHMIDVVKTAKKLGFYTIVVDRDAGSPAKAYADKSYDVSTSDIEKMLEIAEAEKVDGVFNAFDDVNTWNALALCEKLNLPYYATEEQLQVCSDKEKFKECCRSFGVPVIEEYKIDGNLSDEVLAQLEFPVIVKPVDSYASKGITVCHSIEAVKDGYEKALKFSKSQNVIVEPFVDNSYGVQMFYTVHQGNIVLSGVVDRYVHKQTEEHPPLPIAMVFPSQHQDLYIKEVDPNVRRMIKGLGIENGLVFIQSLFENDNFYVYEMGFRFSGELHYKIIEKQTGINLMEMMLDFSVGSNIDDYKIEKYDNGYTPLPSCNLPILLNKGTIDKIVGLEQVQNLPAVVSSVITRSAGETIETIGNYSQMLGRFNLVSETVEELNETILAIHETLHVFSTEGEDMITVKFLPAQEEISR
ncbi:ATP-grasp domain-containing protein [Planococcus shixiaomingii]|uniref:ATP-binding protein n=1 Tax=Planococcus shixiaomingii TaxID=3058393 RepID=UPI0026315AB4|nr:ATP-grasp domain-containing protein [Planococcus sp. N022]WKA54427.1 ATP-grasp domain-containing protein [Planococcus sp. N022]